jgi:transcriptional regulator GlxA family with amidase domain
MAAGSFVYLMHRVEFLRTRAARVVATGACVGSRLKMGLPALPSGQSAQIIQARAPSPASVGVLKLTPQLRNVGFILTDEFTLIAFSSALESLRMANRLYGAPLYEWKTLSVSGGMAFPVNQSITDVAGLDLLMLCGGEHIEQHIDRTLLNTLRLAAQAGKKIGGLSTGSYILARAGLLDGYRATLHWENLASFNEAFPAVIASRELFEIDRNRYTCSGGIAPLDLMLNIVWRDHGLDLASAIFEEFLCERSRGRHDRQRIPLTLTFGTSQPKLIEVIALMEANLEEPMSPDELSNAVALSRRQLECLFQKHLHYAPTRYYLLELCLKKARQLLLQSGMSVVDVALACGFVSAPHSSKCYRDYFHKPPRDERRRVG